MNALPPQPQIQTYQENVELDGMGLLLEAHVLFAKRVTYVNLDLLLQTHQNHSAQQELIVLELTLPTQLRLLM